MQVQALLKGLKRLPRLSALKLQIDRHCFSSSDDEDSDWDGGESLSAGGATCMLRTLEHLQLCEQLKSLELDAPFDLHAPQTLAFVGAALGGRLESLAIGLTLTRLSRSLRYLLPFLASPALHSHWKRNRTAGF